MRNWSQEYPQVSGLTAQAASVRGMATPRGSGKARTFVVCCAGAASGSGLAPKVARPLARARGAGFSTVRQAGRRRWPALALAATVVAACGDADRRAEAPPEPDPYVSTENPRESLSENDYGGLDPSEVGLNHPWTTNSITRDAPGDADVARLTSVTTVSSEGFDRVVFSFSPRLPGYRLSITTDGGGCDGTESSPDAPAVLAVDFDMARSNDGGAPLVDDRERSLEYPALLSAVQACDEGNRVRWLLGASGEVRHRFIEMRGEPRLVVDLQHPEAE